MTRKEAIRAVALHLKSNDEDNTSLDWWTIVAEVALDAFEAIGMAPPINKEKSFTLGEDGQMIYEHREWDKDPDETHED